MFNVLLIILVEIGHTISSKNIKKRIIGGQFAVQNEFPYQVKVRISYNLSLNMDNLEMFRSLCGGSLISIRAVLTAAHCVDKNSYMQEFNPKPIVDDDMNKLDKVLKFNKITLSFGCSQNRTCKQEICINDSSFIKIHPNYSAVLKVNDIAIVKLPENTVILDGTAINTIELDFSHRNYAHEILTLAGWGQIEPEIPYSVFNNLRYTHLRVLSNTKCSEVYKKGQDLFYISIILQNNLCTSHINQRKVVGPCVGDSGSPLVAANGKQIGIFSSIIMPEESNLFCLDPNATSVYTRISNYQDWITNETLFG